MKRHLVLIPLASLALVFVQPAFAQSSFGQALRDAALKALNEALVAQPARVERRDDRSADVKSSDQATSNSSSSPISAGGAFSIEKPEKLAGLQFECRTPAGSTQKRAYLPGDRFYVEDTNRNVSRVLTGRYGASPFTTTGESGKEATGFMPSHARPAYEYRDGRWLEDVSTEKILGGLESISWTKNGIVLDWSTDGKGSCVTLSDASLLDRAITHGQLLSAFLSAKSTAYAEAAATRSKAEKPVRDAAFASMMSARSRAANLVSGAERSGCQNSSFLKRVYFGLENRMVRHQETMASAGAAPMADVLEQLAYDYDGLSKRAREICP